MECKICRSDTLLLANSRILNKYNVDYFQCSNCGFVQTEEPYWLQEAYSSAIASSDVGLVFRNLRLSTIVSKIITESFDHNAKFLDYGGGYGLFVRLMRDLGFDFYWYDKFCNNLFAQSFEINDKSEEHYELVTAFEVFEHFVSPLEELEKILKYSENVLFSTELLPENNPKPTEWAYYALQEGQHVSIYTKKALSIIAANYNLKLYSQKVFPGITIHLITQNRLNLSPILFDQLRDYGQPVIKETSNLQQSEFKVIDNLNDSARDLSITYTKNNANQRVREGLKIVLDCVFFQLYNTGIARVWRSLLEEWAENGFGKYLVILDRAGTTPKIPGIQYRLVPQYDYDASEEDHEMLQRVCDEENADLFISTYYTTPLSTPSVFMAYDMIPEVLKWNVELPMWREKHYSIQHASAYIAISENTARDLSKFFPAISPESITVAYCGVKSIFSSASFEEISTFKKSMES